MDGDAQYVRDFFDGRVDLPMQGDIKGALQMSLAPKRQTVADLVLYTFATGTDSMNRFRNFYGANLSTENRPEEVVRRQVQKRIEEGAVTKSTLKTQVVASKTLNAAFDLLHPEEDRIDFGAGTVLQWLNDEGREPTPEDLASAGALMEAVHQSLEILGGTIKMEGRKSDFENGLHSGVLSFSAWKHYAVDALEECTCTLSQMGREHGYNLEGVDQQVIETASRFEENIQKYRRRGGGNNTMLSDLDEFSDMAQEFTDTSMN
jgi:hypothetical protein